MTVGVLTEKQRIQEASYDFPYHYLDLVIDEYRLLRNVEYLGRLEIVKGLLEPYSGQSILDVGCGDGRFCYELRDKNARVTGVDFSESAIRFARAFNPGVEFFVQDVAHLDLPCQFDDIVLIEALEHFAPDRIPAILQSLARVLKEDGRLILTVPSTNLPLLEKHYQHFTPQTLADTLAPHFRIAKLLGCSRGGYKRSIFFNLQRASLILYPWRKKSSLVRRFLVFVNGYYRKNLEVGQPDECLGLAAVCRK